MNVDTRHMVHAFQLAKKGWYTTRPNPRVGCVLVKDGQVIGEGWHHRAGESHAEVIALEGAGERARGADAYVSLEPCSHQGRTPACTSAIIEAGIRRVIYGTRDPHSVAAGGLESLEKAGIEVLGPVLEPEARELNPGFFAQCERGLPRVTLKIAASLDGRTAMASGESQWITAPAARLDVQRLRAGSAAIITGIGTVLQDDPAMTVRTESFVAEDERSKPLSQPLRVIVDSSLRIRSDLRILQEAGSVLIATAVPTQSIANAESRLQDSGVARNGNLDIISLAENIQGSEAGRQKVDLEALLKELGRRDCHDVLVEAGAKLAGAFLNAGLVDELLVYMAPKLMGSNGWPMAALPFQRMSEAIDLKIIDVRAIGRDWRIRSLLDKNPEGD